MRWVPVLEMAVTVGVVAAAVTIGSNPSVTGQARTTFTAPLTGELECRAMALS